MVFGELAALVPYFVKNSLTIHYLCSLLNMSRSTVMRMKDKLPGRVEVGGSVRYHRKLFTESGNKI